MPSEVSTEDKLFWESRISEAKKSLATCLFYGTPILEMSQDQLLVAIKSLLDDKAAQERYRDQERSMFEAFSQARARF